eukprot:CAMPEP_0174260794 /NCGR_PEP_ID=MMETSP0439-20130205/10559_1 /TAXON_ID=0 /ORGANISM="Stereomyxa ramosa, Strain Chinc5" /LENGTH=291 /DNA_ID=CAMNT_0015345123 /DNA_START=47 /DNA_END=922 /DNA_ORIENTATION=-
MAQWKIPFEELEFVTMIGKGNFGEVWKGGYLGADVAIKKLFFVDDDFMHKYIEREMDTLTRLNHPNVVQLIGLCIGADDLFIVTEFVEGGNLRSKLKDESVEMSWPLKVGILRDVALAMNYLHARGIVHRDLKSHNLLVAQDYRIKVCDFGLARTTPENDQQKQVMTIVGTHEWMAPEVAMGEAYDSTCDVFSFGMVIFEVVTRSKPPTRKLKDAYAFIESDFEALIPKDCPPKLWELLCNCCKTEATERPTFKEIVNVLKTLHSTLGSSSGSTKKVRKKRKKKTKKKTAS